MTEVENVALAAIIMTNYDSGFEKMYEILWTSGIAAYELMVRIAQQFHESTKNVNWDKFMEDPTEYGYPKELQDYEECCIYFYDNYLEANKI